MPKREKIQKSKTKKAKLIHKYYERTGFYSFVGKNLKSAILPIIGVILVGGRPVLSLLALSPSPYLPLLQ